eukprot:12415714-Alexandrium_andersonii.AAC.1
MITDDALVVSVRAGPLVPGSKHAPVDAPLRGPTRWATRHEASPPRGLGPVGDVRLLRLRVPVPGEADIRALPKP